MEADLVLAHLYGVAVAQRLALGGLAIDIGAIRAAQVFDLDFLAMHVEHRVLSTDGQVVDHDVVVGTTPEGGALLGELHFLDDDTVDRHDHFGHDQLL